MHAASLHRALGFSLSCSFLTATPLPALADDGLYERQAVVQIAQAAPAVDHRNPTAAETTRRYHDVRASRLIGMFVHNPANEKMGQIKDLIVDLERGRVHYAVLEFEGAVFAGKKLFVYPLSAFKPSSGGEQLVLAVEKGKLAAAPGFAPDHWPNWHARSQEIDRYFGIAPSAAGAQRRLVRASASLGSDVRDPQGKDVGDLTELVVDMNSAAVRYAVVAFDKPWSLEERLVALPLKAFSVSDQGQLRVNVTREVIASAPGISRRDWPKANLSQDAWIGEVDRYALSLTAPATKPQTTRQP